MTWTSRSISLIGLSILVHAWYSAKEHAALSSTFMKHEISSHGQHHSGPSLPTDICVETVLSTLIVCLGLVLGSQQLRPIQWHVWAGKIERDGDAGFSDGSGDVDKEYHGSPFGILDSRPGFVDIRKQRRDFVSWAKSGRRG
ncbi:hypothetical protein CDD83_1852 [Cordyceps sp. RAO-2017]|nr:hypothetical protein CDD83_1852 [Cordyceps sp. RAO-2017]